MRKQKFGRHPRLIRGSCPGITAPLTGMPSHRVSRGRWRDFQLRWHQTRIGDGLASLANLSDNPMFERRTAVDADTREQPRVRGLRRPHGLWAKCPRTVSARGGRRAEAMLVGSDPFFDSRLERVMCWSSNSPTNSRRFK